ncbi:PepSY domain-containing protein [Ancylobacter lacus]|uniref:PepSY domain-containing protein n=1 Tax=Ancylobacter lacus TaxID=2579970 RepID=UPI001BCD41D3|nr:PepSY domain-containing protein [Ancylobacter lacus]MBS7539359.1 PepSY domain-containing protein [Ancylobacter lacus]
MRVALICAALALSTAPALADDDRPVTDAERAKLDEAMKAQNCDGGRWTYDDDGHFDIDDARCADGKVYDLTFSPEYRLLKKELED